jgi:hypothetical protein
VVEREELRCRRPCLADAQPFRLEEQDGQRRLLLVDVRIAEVGREEQDGVELGYAVAAAVPPLVAVLRR